ncbi:hypothetical protein [Antrihabitans cavernicola]
MASGVFIDWEEMTGQSKFVIDLISFPIFSAIAGLLTNWTGVLMLFAPTRFHGFYMPGVKTIFPFLPRKLQILPTFAPGGILGFQGFVPARAEKMASFVVDKAIAKIGNVNDFVRELEPEGIAAQVAVVLKSQLRPLVDELMEKENPRLWNDLPQSMKEVVYSRAEAQLPEISQRAFAEMGDNIEDLIDVKLLAVGHLRRHPEQLKDIFYGIGAPELRFMVKSGLLGGPMGLLLALYLQIHDKIPVISLIPHWLIILVVAALIGIIVNVIAIKVVFTPGEPMPRYKYLWKQAKLAKRQDAAAGDFGHLLAYKVLSMPNIARELLAGPRGDKTVGMLTEILAKEINGLLGPMSTMVRFAVGGKEMDHISHSAGGLALDLAPSIVEDESFSRDQSSKIDKFASDKLRKMPASEFMDMLYSAIEQDAWLLYAHGGLLGILVGCVHLLTFGA